MGYRPEERIGTNAFEYIHPDDVGRVARILVKGLGSRGVHPPVEMRFRHSDGSWRYLEVVANNLLDDPNVRGIVLTSRITERKRAEDKVRRSESSLAKAQQIAHIANWEYDVEKDEARWSDEMYRIFGFAPQEFIPTYRTFLNSIHPDDKEFIRRSVRRTLYEGKRYSIDFRIVRRDGEVRVVYAQHEVVRSDTGRPIRLVGTVHDIRSCLSS